MSEQVPAAEQAAAGDGPEEPAADPANADQPADQQATATGGGARRSGHWARWAALAVAVPVALLVLVLATRPDPGSRAANSPLLGKPAPEITGRTIDGTEFDLRSSRGKWVLVNFFATWCVPCRQEHPELIRFAERHGPAGRADADVVAVIYDDAESAVRDYRQEEGGDWPMVVDPKGRVALDWGVSGVPESYLISPDGVVAAKVVGGVRLASLESLLAQVSGAAS